MQSWAWLFVALAMFVGAIGREVYHFATSDNRPPVAFSRVEVLNSPINAGGTLQIRVWREKVRDDCPVVSRPFITDENGETLDLLDVFSIGGPAGTEFYDATYLVPIDLHPGSYELFDLLSYRCPNDEFVIPQPTARFVVAP